ncbi:MAG: DUF427 domain-containing protein, partial [Salibacteraceae bacterium]
DSEKRHYAVVDSYNRKLTIIMNGKPIASTTSGLILKEVGKSVYDPVFYIPKKDVSIELLPEPKRTSHCPIKGDATYWNLKSPTSEYFAWSYETPHPRTKKIKGYVAFNMQYITLVSEPL